MDDHEIEQMRIMRANTTPPPNAQPQPLTETYPEEFIEMLCRVGYELWRSCLIAGPPSTSARFTRMDKPVAGDLVMETTAGIIRLYERHGITSMIGRLVSIVREPYPCEEPWDEAAEGKPEPLEEVVYIRRLDTGATVRWTNAKFVTILPQGGWTR